MTSTTESLWDLAVWMIVYMAIPAAALAAAGVIFDIFQWPASRAWQGWWRWMAPVALFVELIALVTTLFLAAQVVTESIRRPSSEAAVGLGVAGFALVLFAMGSMGWLFVFKRAK